ncbi:unnamed protein product, partial [Rotaria sp. Silwood1]
MLTEQFRQLSEQDISQIDSTKEKILVAEDICICSSHEHIRRLVKSTEGTFCVESDDAQAFDFIGKKPSIAA